MGWLCRDDDQPLPRGETRDSYLRCLFKLTSAAEADGHRYEVLASSFVGNTWYAAVRQTFPNGNTQTVAAVVLTRGSERGGFGYKDMDETMGPVESACPPKILAMLSPVEHIAVSDGGRQYAAQWRERCRQHAEKEKEKRQVGRSLVPGTRVRFSEPLKFRNGLTCAEFTVEVAQVNGKSAVCFRSRGGWFCKIPRRLLLAAEIISSGERA